MKELMGDKNLLTEKDIAEAMHDRANQIAQELMDYAFKKYQPTDDPNVVSLAMMGVSITLAKKFGGVPKEMFIARASQVWDTLIAVKR